MVTTNRGVSGVRIVYITGTALAIAFTNNGEKGKKGNKTTAGDQL